MALTVGTSPGFEITDYGESRSDLQTRTEVKYTLRHPDFGKLRKALASACRTISHNEAVSTVRSLYYDDHSLSACRANLNGLGRREKLRLRWYDVLEAPDDFYLEIKWRRNLVTGKHRFKVSSDTSLHELSFREIHRRLLHVTPEKHLRKIYRNTDPIVIVEYQREHFVSPDSEIRLTLDYALRFYDQVGRRKMSSKFPQELDGFCVVEGKTPIGREQELKALLYPLSTRADRCSKYVHGCRMLNHIRGGE